MSATALREPWFLKGRTSVAQRAILTSVVLGGMGFVAGEAIHVSDSMVLRIWKSGPGQHSLLAVADGLASIILVTVVFLPCAYWVGHSVAGTILRSLWITFVINSQLLGGQTFGELFYSEFYGDTTHWLIEWLSGPARNLGVDVWVLVRPTLFWLALSSASFLCSWTWPTAAGASFLSIPVSVLLIHGIPVIDPLIRSLFSGSPLWSWAGNLFGWYYFGQYWFVLVTPWGIPFWFPPAREPTPQ